MGVENLVKANEDATQTVLISMGPFSLQFSVPVMLPVIAFHHGNAMPKSKLAMKSAACCFLVLALTWQTAEALPVWCNSCYHTPCLFWH